jgi:hypothetical protein
LGFLLLLIPASRAFPLCTDQSQHTYTTAAQPQGRTGHLHFSCSSLLAVSCAGAPLPLNGTLAFCGYTGASCCDAAADAALRKQFDAANVSDAPCAAVLKSILCAVCTPALHVLDGLLPCIKSS